MNKLSYALSTLLLAAAAAPVCQAQEGLSYGYCSDNITGNGFNSSDKYWIAAAFRMTEADVERFNDCEVTGVSIGFGSGRNKEIKVFMTYDLAEEPFYTQTGRVRAHQWVDIPVTNPVKIEKGKPFYIGYRYYVDNLSAHPIGGDDNVLSFTDGADWMSGAMTEDALAGAWQQYGSSVGNVCIRAIINGDNLPQSSCVPVGLIMPELATPGENFDFTLSFTNASTAEVKNVEVIYKLGEDEEQTVEYTFPEPVAPNARGEVKITAKTDQDQLEIPSWASISKVNGEPNDMAERKAYGTLVCTTGLFERKMVVEKFTGVYCGYCPRGIAGFDHMNKYYAGTFIGIAIQNYSTSDPMYCPAYLPWSEVYKGGAPHCTINRNKLFSTNPEKGVLEAAYNQIYTRTSNIGIKVKAEPTASSHAYNVTATVNVARDVEDVDYAIVFVATEDKVGPYGQINNYNSMPGCPEFSGKGSTVSMLYDDVARNISSEWTGCANSVPSSLKAGEDYNYSVDNFSLGNTKVPMNANIIALLVDKSTGEIINADRIHLDPNRVDEPVAKPDDPVTGNVDSVTAADLYVDGGLGTISFFAEEGVAHVYSTSGQLMGIIEAGSSINAAPGLYIVKTKAGNCKVQVK